MNANYGSSVDGGTPTSKAGSSTTSSVVEHDPAGMPCKRVLDVGVGSSSLVGHDSTARSLCKRILDGDVDVSPVDGDSVDRPSSKRILDVDVDLPSVGGLSGSLVGSSSPLGMSGVSGSSAKYAKTGVVKVEPKK